jgi:hypothetical protein
LYFTDKILRLTRSHHLSIDPPSTTKRYPSPEAGVVHIFFA